MKLQIDALENQTAALQGQAAAAAFDAQKDLAIYAELKEGAKKAGALALVAFGLYYTRKFWSRYL